MFYSAGFKCYLLTHFLHEHCPLFIRDKHRADCVAKELGPHAVRGPREKKEVGVRMERRGKRLSNIINLLSPHLQQSCAGTTDCSRLHRGNLLRGRTPAYSSNIERAR